MDCPACGLVNPPEALLCDCGAMLKESSTPGMAQAVSERSERQRWSRFYAPVPFIKKWWFWPLILVVIMRAAWVCYRNATEVGGTPSINP